jgi:hypothetical protein
MKKHFYSVHLYGEVPQIQDDLPVILLPNHNTWWDGFFAYLITSNVLSRPIYLMMTEEQLQNYPFFSRVGAYSINLKNRKRMLDSLDYTHKILMGYDRKAVCIFPEGELKCYHVGSMEYKRGIQWIMQRLQREVNLVQMAIRIEFLEQQRPEVFIKLGDAVVAGSDSFPGLDNLESRHAQLLSSLENKIQSGQKGEMLLHGKSSIHEAYSKVASAIGWKT